jgi:hypothetical protein
LKSGLDTGVSEATGPKEQDFMQSRERDGYYEQEVEGEKEAARQTRKAEHARPRLGDDEDEYGSHAEPKAAQLAAE